MRPPRAKLARHSEAYPWACVGQLLLSFERSHRGPWESLVVMRCKGCGKIVDVQGVIPEPVTAWDDDNPDDDITAWGV